MKKLVRLFYTKLTKDKANSKIFIDRVSHILQRRIILNFQDFICRDLLPTINKEAFNFKPELDDTIILATNCTKKHPTLIPHNLDHIQDLEDLYNQFDYMERDNRAKIFVILKKEPRMIEIQSNLGSPEPVSPIAVNPALPIAAEPVSPIAAGPASPITTKPASPVAVRPEIPMAASIINLIDSEPNIYELDAIETARLQTPQPTAIPEPRTTLKLKAIEKAHPSASRPRMKGKYFSSVAEMRAFLDRIDTAIAQGDSDDGGSPLFHEDMVLFGKPPPPGEPFDLSSASLQEAKAVREAMGIKTPPRKRVTSPQFIWPQGWEFTPVSAPESIPVAIPTAVPASASIPAAVPISASIPTAIPTSASIPATIPASASISAAIPTSVSVPAAVPISISIPAAVPTSVSIPTAIPTSASIPAAVSTSVPTSTSIPESIQLQKPRSKRSTRQNQQVSESASMPTFTSMSKSVRSQQTRSTQRKRMDPTDVDTPPARRTRSRLAGKKD